MTSATAETRVVADVDGAQTGDAGDVIWTAFTTNDTTVPANLSTLDLNARDFLTFEKFIFIGGNESGQCVRSFGDARNITFRDCVMIAGAYGLVTVRHSVAAQATISWLLDRCVVIGFGAGPIQITLASSSSGADWDTGVTVRNCLILTGSGVDGVMFESTGGLTFKPGGFDVENCTIIGGLRAVRTSATSTSVASTIYNSICHGQSTACIAASASGELIEDYNALLASTARANVTAGANSVAGSPYARAPMFEIGQAWLNGRTPRPFLMPMTGNPLLGFGNQAGSPDVDFLNRPRPAGGASIVKGIGYLERHDTGSRETSTVRTGSNAIKLNGPADHDFQLPVSAAATTVRVWGRFDTTYSGTKPSMSVVNGGEAGVSDATATMTGAADTWEELTLTFTPTAAGIVTIRLRNQSTTTAGACWFDDFSVT